MAFEVADIRQHGRQQGSLFSVESTRDLLGAQIQGGEARLILATHDCDILHQGSHEPKIDAFIATPVQCLKAHAPAHDAALGTNLPIFREWLGKRYDRAAWPDSFNERLKRQRTDQAIRAILTPSEHCFRDIFLAIEPDSEELAQDAVPYVVRVALVMTEANAGRVDIVEETQRCATALTDVLRACPGIEVEAVETITDTDFTLADLDTYRFWDFTDLSFPD